MVLFTVHTTCFSIALHSLVNCIWRLLVLVLDSFFFVCRFFSLRVCSFVYEGFSLCCNYGGGVDRGGADSS